MVVCPRCQKIDGLIGETTGGVTMMQASNIGYVRLRPLIELILHSIDDHAWKVSLVIRCLFHPQNMPWA